MSNEIKYQLEGIPEVLQRLEQVRGDLRAELAAALEIECTGLMNEANIDVPVKTGKLRDSAYVGYPSIQDDYAVVEAGYTAPYAPEVHEDESRPHVNGRARWLALALESVSKVMPDRLARWIKLK